MKRTEALAKKIASSSPVLRKMARRALYSAGARRYRRVTSGIARAPRRILFASYNGASYSCSPKALYEHLLHDSRFDGFEFVWAFKDVEAHAYLESEPRTRLVAFGTDDHLRELRAAKCWVTNSRIYEYVWPAPDQLYVQCWHGTPLKRLGLDLDVSSSPLNDLSEVRRKYLVEAKKFNCLVSPSPFASAAFASAFGLGELGKAGVIAEIGYPRNDALFSPSPEEIAAAKERVGIAPGDERKVLLYAPTFRDDEFAAGGAYSNGVTVDFGKLREALGDGYLILLRTHYLAAAGMELEKYGGFVADRSGYDDVNDLLLAADLLITDYSSLFFDYADLGKPLLFFMPDLEKYERETRGFYLDTGELPGMIVRDEKLLARSIVQTLEKFVYNEIYQRFHEKFGPLDDGCASARLADLIAADIV